MVPEGMVTSPDAEYTDPQWLQVSAAQRYLTALIDYADGKIEIGMVDSLYLELKEEWDEADKKDPQDSTKTLTRFK